MAKERADGIQEQMLQCLQNMETHLGLIAKNPGLATTTNVTNQGAAAVAAPAKAAPAAPTVQAAAQTAAVAEPTADDIRKILKDYAEKFGREAAIKVLADNGFKNAGAVPAEKRAEFMDYVEKSTNEAF